MKQPVRIVRTLIAAAVTSVVLAGCMTTSIQPQGADDARNKLMQLQSDSQLATRAPVAIKDAELAVRVAEEPQVDKETSDHLVFMANRKIELARALAQSRMLVDQREMLNKQRADAQLESRTRELKNARSETKSARTDSLAAQQQASALLDSRTRELESARNETEFARIDTVIAQQQAADMQRQIVELNAKPTERGLVVTLGDLLFDTGKSELKSGAATNLAKLAAFLTQYEDRSVLIEGHTDNMGSDDFNLGLSQRRADSVKNWLVNQGVATGRLVTSGKGEGLPVADNNSASGRQLNRRVEVIIANTVATDDLVLNRPL